MPIELNQVKSIETGEDTLVAKSNTLFTHSLLEREREREFTERKVKNSISFNSLDAFYVRILNLNLKIR